MNTDITYLPLPLSNGVDGFAGFAPDPLEAIAEPGVFFVHDIQCRIYYSGTPEQAQFHIQLQTPTDPNRMRLLRPLILALMVKQAQCEPDGVERTLDQLRDEAMELVTKMKMKREG